jgi:hypothetical protein
VKRQELDRQFSIRALGLFVDPTERVFSFFGAKPFLFSLVRERPDSLPEFLMKNDRVLPSFLQLSSVLILPAICSSAVLS